MYVIDMDAHPPVSTMDIAYVGRCSTKDFLDRMNEFGIDKVCGTLIPPQSFYDCRSKAEATAELNELSYKLSKEDSRYIPIVIADPDFAEESLCQMKKYASLGVKAVEMDANKPLNDEFYKLLGYAEELGMLTVLKGNSAPFLKDLFSRFPALKILATDLHPAHLPSLNEGCDNLYIATSAPVWGYNYVIHEWTVKYPCRFTFSSCHPYWNAIHKLASIKWELRDSDLDTAEKIFFKNAVSALGIKEAQK
jgi:predicted TIM-barrel fold metal-dependent hydrolase